MVKVTWQNLRKFKWPKETWPRAIVKAFNDWSRRSGPWTGMGSSRRANASGYDYFSGNTDLEVFETSC